jgi:hypothetical protein
MVTMTRQEILAYRLGAQQLDRRATAPADAAVLDIGVQDTGPDGGLWALAIRGVDVASLPGDALSTLWTVRGAPHLYRRADLPSIAAAVEPLSDDDAGKRIYDAAKPLKAAGIGNLEALDAVAAAMRGVVARPTAKGDVSGAVAKLMAEPYLRFCRPCNATHLFEMPFRLAALRAGLELQPGTSPPVLQRIKGFKWAARPQPVPPRFDLIRAYLRLLGPATPKHVADYLDAPVKDVKAHWPDDTVEVTVGKERRWLLAADESAAAMAGIADTTTTARLLGPYDLFLQLKDRATLLTDPARVKAMWPVLGRPGAMLVDGDIAGAWRPRKAGAKLRLRLDWWTRPTKAVREAITVEAERLAAHRGSALAGLDET